MEKLIELVLRLNEKIGDEISHINAGGCGVFALQMSKKLEELGYTPKIAIIDYNDTTFSKRKETLNNVINNVKVEEYQKKDTSFVHCCIEIDGLLFDGTNIGSALKDRWSGYRFSGHYSVKELEISLKVGGWNKRWNRRKNNPTLRKIIRSSVREVFN